MYKYAYLKVDVCTFRVSVIISQASILDLIITNRWRRRIKSETDDD